MRLGALLGPITDGSDHRALAEQAKCYAGEGFSSLWTAQAIGRGFMITDPFVALTVAAIVTEDVEIGTAVIQLSLYEPADLAHRILSLQQICGNRLLIGVGAGSTEADFLAFNRDYGERFSRFKQTLKQLREFLKHGQSGDIDLSLWPTMSAKPQLLFGTWGNGVVQAAKDYAGWIASAHYRTPTQVVEKLGEFRAAGGGRAIVSTIQLGPKTDLGETKELLSTFASAGFDDAVVMLLPGGPAAADIVGLQ